ncbi:rhomboid-related protein 4-like [Crassostrea virginica]
MARRGQNLGLFLLMMQVMNIGIENIPPVTLISTIVQVVIFLELGNVYRWFPSPSHVCISAFNILDRQEWKRMILGSLYHADDFHLYYNMVSFLWKGRQLERRFGSVYFGFLLVIFTVLTSIVYVAINVIMSEVFDDRSYRMQCAVGFSGVIFALKVLVTHYSPSGMQYILGAIPVPSKYIFWAELVLIQIITPNASFVGHLAGILVGLAYTKGPLKIIMDSFFQPSEYRRFSGGGYASARSDNYSGYRYRNDTGYRNQNYPANTNDRYSDYTGGLSEEEQLRRAQEESMREGQDTRTPSRPLYPDLDDLRRRRAERFN